MTSQVEAMLASQDVFQHLYESRARLLNSVTLNNNLGFALWENELDEVRYTQPKHHTLSCYVSGGYKVERVTGAGIADGGAPQKLCLMPSEHEYDWKVNDPIQLIHFYFSDQDLTRLSEKVWDKSAGQIFLDDRTFLEDPYLANIFTHMVSSLNWQERADQLALYSSTQLLMIHLLKNYCSYTLPSLKNTGGLTGYQVRRVKEYIAAHLGASLSIPELAAQVGLSEYHFSRMFRQSTGVTPHQFVTSQRIAFSKRLLQCRGATLSDIACQAGFSSQSHFSSRFRQLEKMTPVQYRKSVWK